MQGFKVSNYTLMSSSVLCLHSPSCKTYTQRKKQTAFDEYILWNPDRNSGVCLCYEYIHKDFVGMQFTGL